LSPSMFSCSFSTFLSIPMRWKMFLIHRRGLFGCLRFGVATRAENALSTWQGLPRPCR
jgi:hypothetical protein